MGSVPPLFYLDPFKRVGYSVAADLVIVPAMLIAATLDNQNGNQEGGTHEIY